MSRANGICSSVSMRTITRFGADHGLSLANDDNLGIIRKLWARTAHFVSIPELMTNLWEIIEIALPNRLPKFPKAGFSTQCRVRTHLTGGSKGSVTFPLSVHRMLANATMLLAS